MASFSALGLSLSVTAMILLPISVMSAHGKPCAIESESTPSLPSIAMQLVDEAAHRLARGVEHADHAAVDQVAITGLVRPSMAPP